MPVQAPHPGPGEFLIGTFSKSHAGTGKNMYTEAFSHYTAREDASFLVHHRIPFSSFIPALHHC